jgi:polyisoprenoid-binding protein YceI
MWPKSYQVILIFCVAIAGCSGEPKGENKKPDDPKGPATVESGSVALDSENTKIEFVGTKPEGSHQGGFKEFSGKIALDGKSVEKISLEIQTASLWADDDKLANHLKSPDFFNVKENPTASFESSKVETKDETSGEHIITGELTMLAKAKEITFPATIKNEGGKVTLTSQFKIDRTDFGMDFGQDKVDNEVTIHVEVGSADKAAADDGTK